MATPLRIPDVRSLKQFIDRPVGPSEWVTISLSEAFSWRAESSIRPSRR